jgi:hypothetical protein
VRVLQSAARAVDLAQSIGLEVDAEYLRTLEKAKSNLPAFADGLRVYRRLAASARAGLEKIAAGAAILEHAGFPEPGRGRLRATVGSARRESLTGLGGRDRSLSVAPVSAVAGGGFPAAWTAVVHRADRLDFACWLGLAADVDTDRIVADFKRLPDEEFRAAMDGRLGPAPFGLDAVSADARAELMRTLTPDVGLGSERATFLKRWIAAIGAVRRGGGEDDPLLDLLSSASKLGFPPADLPWSTSLEPLMLERFESAAAGGDPAVASRALRWLDALWSAGLVVRRWSLRDVQDRWSLNLQTLSSTAEKDACRALGERLGLAETMLAEATPW